MMPKMTARGGSETCRWSLINREKRAYIRRKDENVRYAT
jgi:hypothetical protein